MENFSIIFTSKILNFFSYFDQLINFFNLNRFAVVAFKHAIAETTTAPEGTTSTGAAKKDGTAATQAVKTTKRTQMDPDHLTEKPKVKSSGLCVSFDVLILF